MTSKISFSKFIRADIRHRAWLAALFWILLLLGQTIYTMLMLERALSADFSELAQKYQMEGIRECFPGFLNSSVGLAAILFLMAILCAVTGFSYLHSAERTDFYHSLPLSRTQWFTISYMSGILMFLIPYLVCSVLTILAGVSFDVMTTSIFSKSWVAVLGGILAFLLIYHVTILAMLLTGKVVTGVLAALALSVYGSMAGGIGYNLASYFLDTYSGQGEQFMSKISGFLSPYVLYAQILGNTAGNNENFDWFSGGFYFMRRLFRASSESNLLFLIGYTVLFLAALLVLSLWLYKKRPLEAAGNALAYPKTAPWIKVLVSIPTALFLGILIGSTYSSGTKWIIIISILAVILLCGLVEFIYHMDLRRLFAGKYSSLASILGVVGILCIFQFDVFGYDAWLPRENSLESMSFEINELYSYFHIYPDAVAYNIDALNGPDLLNGEEGAFYDFAPIYELAQEGVENVSNGITIDSTDASNEYVDLTVRYNKKRGRSSYRNYKVSKQSALNTLVSLCEDEDYRRTLFPVFRIDPNLVKVIRIADIYQEEIPLPLSKEKVEALLDAYEKDMLNVDMRELQNEYPLAGFSVELRHNNGFSVIPMYLYDSSENTLALLKEYGYTIRREIAPEDVESMKLIELDTSDTMDVYNTIPFTSKNTPVGGSWERPIAGTKNTEKILSQIHYSVDRLLGRDITSRSVEIIFTGDTEPTYFPLP